MQIEANYRVSFLSTQRTSAAAGAAGRAAQPYTFVVKCGKKVCTRNLSYEISGTKKVVLNSTHFVNITHENIYKFKLDQ